MKQIELSEEEFAEIGKLIAKKDREVAWVLANKQPENKAALEQRSAILKSIAAKFPKGEEK